MIPRAYTTLPGKPAGNLRKKPGGPRQCRWHTKAFICDRCKEVTKTDVHGFPHCHFERGPDHPKRGGQAAAHLLRKRLRICSGCESPKSWNEWDRARGQCLACSGALTVVEL